MNQTIDLLDRRVSLRAYADRDIHGEHLDAVIESAMRAPTAGNMMLYSIIVIRDGKKKKQLSESCDHQPFIANAPVVLVFVADMQRWFDYYDRCGVKQFCETRDLEYAGPDVADLLLCASDALIAAQNAVVAAESLGIGSCYIGDIMENYETHREMLDLPDWAFPISMLCLGYYPENHKRVRRVRFDREYVVFGEQYRRLSPDELDAMFEERQSRFPQNNSVGATNVGQLTYARKTGSAFAREMARSVKAALKRWDGRAL